MLDIVFVGCVMSNCPVFQTLLIIENRSNDEAAAWVKKYLMEASIARGWCCLAISGMIASILISSPTHAIIQ